MHIYEIATAFFSFVVGSIPFGYFVAKSKGIDIRQYGSGNIGATNVYRTVGKKDGIATLFLDLLKGVLPVAVASIFFQNNPEYKYIAAVFVVLGHDFSLFLKFKGGKGVATTYGATLGISLYSALIGMAIWIAILIKTKYSSLAALLSFGISTIASFSVFSNGQREYLFLGLWLLMIVKHRENIKRIFKKEEKSIEL